MTTVSNTEKARPMWLRALLAFWGWLASLQLAVFLLVVLAAVLAFATILEAWRGTEYAQWYVYWSRWFMALWALLGVNMLASALVRLPWKRRHIGFLITHAGVLVIMLGALATYLGGIEGQVVMGEGEAADSILLSNRSQLRVTGHGPSGRLSTEFAFSPGPVDWGPQKPLDFGQSDGLGIRVLEFYHHARPRVEWIADESAEAPPAIKLALAESPSDAGEEFWCPANPFGDRQEEGRPTIEFQQAPAASMLEDFLKPPAEGLGQKGLLSVHYQGQKYPIPVDGNVGQKVPLGETGASVTIVDYFPTAVVEGGGRFSSASPEPKNPLLQLEIRLPGEAKPIDEIAFAKNPFVSLAMMRGGECPVRFWYHHPAVLPPTGIQFLQTPDGKLYCRAGSGGKYVHHGEVKLGQRVELVAGLEMAVLDLLPHARQRITYQPAAPTDPEADRLEAAALVELTVDGHSQSVWLRRSDQPGEAETVDTPRGPLAISLGYQRIPLGFSLKLIDFKRGMNPGRMGDASFASHVQLIDKAAGIDEPREISMNQPLAYGKYAFYQSSFQELPGGEMSILSAAYDPGRPLKYAGSAMVCAGVFIVFYLKGRSRKNNKAAAANPGRETAEPSSPPKPLPLRSVACAE